VTDAEILTVSEVFGPTVQGEGPSAGQRAGFLRLGRCNLCCQWCDTRFSWDWGRYDPDRELSTWTTGNLLRQLDGMQVDLVVITGGEPLLQQRALVPLLRALRDRQKTVEVETNGTLRPTVDDGLVTQWNVSPKLANSGMTLERRYRPDVLRAFQATGRAVFKFVVTHADELDEVQAMVDGCGLTNIYVMPEGTDAATITDRMQQLVDPVVARGWNLTSRLHILIWGDRRGV
jgi:7-cyano-7-deazaguanosine (preQ0) biosynthesis protein QueE